MFDNYFVQHDFVTTKECVDLFRNTNTFRKFQNKLKILSKQLPQQYPVKWNTHTNPNDNEKKVLGDAFELFTELFVLHFGFHPQIGLTQYTPTDPNKDVGVDALAVNVLNEKCAIQCKYISDETKELTANEQHLGNFLNAAIFEGINWQEDGKVKRLFLMTTGKGLHYFTDNEMFHGRVRTIGIQAIRQLVDGNEIFWQSCLRILENNQK